METTCSIADWVERIKTIKNFRELDESFIERLVRQALALNSDEKEILSFIKTTIQEVTNQFRNTDDTYREMIAELDESPDHAPASEETGLFAADLLRRHEASKERIPFIRRYYEEIFSLLPPIGSILDLGCGLNPVSVTFMPVSRQVHYTAVDLPLDIVDFINHFFPSVRISGIAMQANLLDGIPAVEADLTLVQKTLPFLETVEKGAARRLFDAIRSPNAVVSFKTEKKPPKTGDDTPDFGAEFESWLTGTDWKAVKRIYPNEIVFVLNR